MNEFNFFRNDCCAGFFRWTTNLGQLLFMKISSYFARHRFTTVRRRTAHRLSRLQAREHLVQGMARALQRIDDVIRVMKTSKDSAAARDALMAQEYAFSLEQVKYL